MSWGRTKTLRWYNKRQWCFYVFECGSLGWSWNIIKQVLLSLFFILKLLDVCVLVWCDMRWVCFLCVLLFVKTFVFRNLKVGVCFIKIYTFRYVLYVLYIQAHHSTQKVKRPKMFFIHFNFVLMNIFVGIGREYNVYFWRKKGLSLLFVWMFVGWNLKEIASGQLKKVKRKRSQNKV